jgi:hypothetical protein
MKGARSWAAMTGAVLLGGLAACFIYQLVLQALDNWPSAIVLIVWVVSSVAYYLIWGRAQIAKARKLRGEKSN